MALKLFTKTYKKDFDWLRLAVATVAKHCTDKVEWTLVCEQGERAECVGIFRANCGDNLDVQGFEVQDLWPEAMKISDGYLRQQWVKMNAHRAMRNDYFLNWDSDVVALRPFNEASFLGKSGLPIYWYTPFNSIISWCENNGKLSEVSVHKSRQFFIQRVFEIPEAPFEWMRCMPIWMNGGILSVAAKHPSWNKVLGLMMGGAAGISEFNIIGQFSNIHFPDMFEWKNTEGRETWAGPIDSQKAIVSQLWSWGGGVDKVREALHL